MTEVEKLNILKDKKLRLSNNPKDIKSPGVLKKINRQIRNIESKISQ